MTNSELFEFDRFTFTSNLFTISFFNRGIRLFFPYVSLKLIDVLKKAISRSQLNKFAARSLVINLASFKSPFAPVCIPTAITLPSLLASIGLPLLPSKVDSLWLRMGEWMDMASDFQRANWMAEF